MSPYHNMKTQCQQHLNKPVQLQVQGQHNYSGIIEHVDDEHVYMMVPINETGQYMDLAQLMQGMNAQPMYDNGHEYEQAFSYYPQQSLARQTESDQRYPFYPLGYYSYPGFYQPYPLYPYPYAYAPYPRPIGWSRLILPLAALTALAVL